MSECLNCMQMERERDHARGELGRARFRADNDITALRAEVERLTNLHHTGVAYMAEADKALTTLRATNERLVKAITIAEDTLADVGLDDALLKIRAALAEEKKE